MQPPMVGLLIREVGGIAMIRCACGMGRRCSRLVSKVPIGDVARDATPREQVLGFPVDPVPKRHFMDTASVK
jgi:hypothetical protein